MKSLSLLFSLFYMLMCLFVSFGQVPEEYSDLTIPGLVLDLPAFPGGRPADEIYLAGSGMLSDWDGLTGNENRMQVISHTTIYQYNSYCNTLSSNGYNCVFQNEKDGITAKAFRSENRLIYVYHCEKTQETRIIEDNSKSYPENFGYSGNEGEGVTIYQFDLPYADSIDSDTSLYSINGMLYIIRLADNSLVVIDGGSIEQSSDNNIDECMKFMHKITGTSASEKVKISLWYGTHGHSDHVTFFYKLLGHYNKQIELDRVAFNYPSLSLITHNHRIDMIRDRLAVLYPDVKYLNLHTGMTFNIDNLLIEVLYTHEDAVDATTGKTPVVNPNDASTICRLSATGKSFLVLGDINIIGEDQLFRMYDSSVFKTDVAQAAHHLYNAVEGLYHYTYADYVFCPNAKGDTQYRKYGYPILQQYYSDDQLLFANDAIYGIEFSPDGITVTTDHSTCGPYDNSSMNKIK